MGLVFFGGAQGQRQSNLLKTVEVGEAGFFKEEAELASVCMCMSEWVGACVGDDLQMPLPLEQKFVARAHARRILLVLSWPWKRTLRGGMRPKCRKTSEQRSERRVISSRACISNTCHVISMINKRYVHTVIMSVDFVECDVLAHNQWNCGRRGLKEGFMPCMRTSWE